MRRAVLKAQTRRGFRPCRNSSGRAAGVAENLLQQDFSSPAPNRCWAGDITYLRTTAGWRYLSVWIDLYSRRVVGWAMGATMETTLVLEALNRALGQRQLEPDQLLIHTDQGSQYRATAYQQLLEDRQISCSMSAKGCCWDNAVWKAFLHLQTRMFPNDNAKNPEKPSGSVQKFGILDRWLLQTRASSLNDCLPQPDRLRAAVHRPAKLDNVIAITCPLNRNNTVPCHVSPTSQPHADAPSSNLATASFRPVPATAPVSAGSAVWIARRRCGGGSGITGA